jgi:hypothetical protein
MNDKKEKPKSGLIYFIGDCPECHNGIHETGNPFNPGHTAACSKGEGKNGQDSHKSEVSR